MTIRLHQAIRDLQLAQVAEDGAVRGYRFRLAELNRCEPYAITRQAEGDRSWARMQSYKFRYDAAKTRLIALALGTPSGAEGDRVEMEVSS